MTWMNEEKVGRIVGVSMGLVWGIIWVSILRILNFDSMLYWGFMSGTIYMFFTWQFMVEFLIKKIEKWLKEG